MPILPALKAYKVKRVIVCGFVAIPSLNGLSVDVDHGVALLG